MATHNPSRLAVQVGARAGYRCEYCLTPHAITAQTFHADHILPQSRGGQTTLENLCFACPRCNLRKADQIEGRDPRTKQIALLFNPRTQNWHDHFRWSVDYRRVIGRPPTGRATVATLDMNSPVLRRARVMWALLDLIP